MKKRPIEQRGRRSLLETQYVQKELLGKGFPVPVLWEDPDGNNLLWGTDGASDEFAGFEVQQMLEGDRPHLSEATAEPIGHLLGRFHQAGREIETYLLNKGYWIRDFTVRRQDSLDRMHECLDRSGVSRSDARIIEGIIERTSSFLSISSRTWGLYHGDMCCNNLISTAEGYFMVDMDEVGLGEVWGDLLSLSSEAQDDDLAILCSLLEGYRAGGGTLVEEDLVAISDAIVLGKFRKAVEAGAQVDMSSLVEFTAPVLDM